MENMTRVQHLDKAQDALGEVVAHLRQANAYDFARDLVMQLTDYILEVKYVQTEDVEIE